VRYKDIAAELDRRQITRAAFASGVRRFLQGLGKKVLLANAIGALWDVYKAMDPSSLSVADAWLGAVAFTLQIYFDFSGYSDMAIGLGRMLGFAFPENFRYPYLADSITDFWRRWHITLSSWFRDYVYIPLGGNRRGLGRQLLNLLIVWCLTGIWHGASWNYLLWGLYYALLLMLEKSFLLRRLEGGPRWLAHVYALFLVVVGWVLFSLEDLGQCAAYLAAMFGGGSGLVSSTFLYYLRSFGPSLVILILCATPLPRRVFDRLPEKVRGCALPVLLLGVLVLATAYLVDGSYNPFLYFRF
jgi:alginate O-acetyltransferase complex protein AlgI